MVNLSIPKYFDMNNKDFMVREGFNKKNSKIWDIYQIRTDPTLPWGNCDIKNCDKIQKILPPPPLKKFVTFFNKCLKVRLQESAQFEENGSLMILNLTKIEQILIVTMKKHWK